MCFSTRRRSKWALLVAMLSVVWLVGFGSATPAQADPDCKSVYGVFVRGSGEHLNDKRAHVFYVALKNAVEARGLSFGFSELGNEDGSVPVDMGANPDSYNGVQPNAAYKDPYDEYPAVPVDNWSVVNVVNGKYNNSVVVGSNELVAHLNQRYLPGPVGRGCSNESLVLGGYSQGADVVGWTLQRSDLLQVVRDHVGYVALYGDPKFDPGALSQRQQWQRPWWVRGDDPGFRYAVSGNVVLDSGALGPRQPYVSDQFQGRFGSWCAYRDGICTGSVVPSTDPGTHSSAYDATPNWIALSVPEIANKAITKRNELNPSLLPATGPSYTIAEPNPSVNVPVTVLPRIKSVKRTTDPSGTPQVYAATNSAITEAWWHPGGDGVHTSEVIHIAQDNIVGFDKVNLPEGKQALYTAVPDGIWETWWDAQHSPGSAKIISGLSGVRSVVAANRWESGQYVHRLYVLAGDGPWEFWWKDGDPEGIHKSRLVNINEPVTMTKSTGPDGEDQLYVASADWVYEIWWKPDTGVKYGTVINISQRDINSLSKTLVGGEQRLFTGTSTSVWQSKWNGSTAPAHSAEVSGRTGIIHSQAMRTGSAYQIYIATTGGVREYWYSSTGAGNSNVVNRSQQGDISTFVKFNDGAAQQIYTGTNRGEVYETWWGGGTSPTTSKLFEVAR